jgi:hypothetical protein
MSHALLTIIGLSPIVMMVVAEWFGKSPAASPRVQVFCRRTFRLLRGCIWGRPFWRWHSLRWRCF